MLKHEKLEVEKGASLTDPNPIAIAKALRQLTPSGNSFAIYLRGGNGGTYMQTACSDDGFVLEYQEGSIESHYEAEEDQIPLDRVIDVFRRYARGDDSWKADFNWRKLEL